MVHRVPKAQQESLAAMVLTAALAPLAARVWQAPLATLALWAPREAREPWDLPGSLDPLEPMETKAPLALLVSPKSQPKPDTVPIYATCTG